MISGIQAKNGWFGKYPDQTINKKSSLRSEYSGGEQPGSRNNQTTKWDVGIWKTFQIVRHEKISTKCEQGTKKTISRETVSQISLEPIEDYIDWSFPNLESKQSKIQNLPKTAALFENLPQQQFQSDHWSVLHGDHQINWCNQFEGIEPTLATAINLKA